MKHPLIPWALAACAGLAQAPIASDLPLDPARLPPAARAFPHAVCEQAGDDCRWARGAGSAAPVRQHEQPSCFRGALCEIHDLQLTEGEQTCVRAGATFPTTTR